MAEDPSPTAASTETRPSSTIRPRVVLEALAVWVVLLWVVLTVSFEFLFGHYVMGTSWDRLLHDYNVLAGRVWVLILLTLLVGPLLFGHYLRDE